MKAGKCLCSRPLVGALAVGLLVLGTSAFGQEMRFFPIRSASLGSPVGTIGSPVAPVFNAALNCWELTLTAGGVEVDVDVQGKEWELAAGAPGLGAMQGTIDPAGYDNDGGGPVGDLSPKGWPGSPSDGAYQAISTCTDNGDPCVAPFDATCGGRPGAFCIRNTSWVFPATCSDLPAIATPTLDYAWASVGQNVGCAPSSGGNFLTVGGLILEVPNDAAGTYRLDFNTGAAFSFMSADDGSPIPGVSFTSACITIITGKCCSNIGPNVACAAGLTAGQCAAELQPNAFTEGGVCNGPLPSDDCASCTVNSDCEDPPGSDDLCTDNICNPDGTCSNPLNFDPLIDACNPDSGGTTPIDDTNGLACNTDADCFGICVAAAGECEDVCTDNVPQPDGTVLHPNNTNPCDDRNACTFNDVCAAGVCEGTDANGLACPNGDADCPVGRCLATAVCECLLCTPLVINIDAGGAADPNCFADGETISVQLALGVGGSEDINGAQALLNYDPACVEILSADICGGSIYDSPLDIDISVPGVVWAAVTADPANPTSSKGPQDILCMEFRKLPGCDGCDFCYSSVNPRNTILSSSTGNSIAVCPGAECSKLFRGRGLIDLVIPPGADVNADCAVPSAIVTWDAASASDSCDGTLTVDCIAEHVGGLPINHLIDNGGEFPQGVSFFRCEATNTCGDTAIKVWTVDVSDQQGLHVTVELNGGTINQGEFSRAIDFALYGGDCSGVPAEFCEVMDFGGPLNFPAHARAWLKVDKGNFLCITAQDTLHTLRSAADVECIDNAWSATFKGDMDIGGNGLNGGNLDCWKNGGNCNVIDVLDAGVYLGVIASAVTAPGMNTDCNTPGPHADVNADGVVDSADFTYVMDNFLKASKDACCPAGTAAAGNVPILSITIKELRARGMSELIVADLNSDGVLDTEDMALYMEGVDPVSVQQSKKRAFGTR